MEHLLNVANGDAISLLNALELAVATTPAGGDGVVRVDRLVAEESIQRRAVLYDKEGSRPLRHHQRVHQERARLRSRRLAVLDGAHGIRRRGSALPVPAHADPGGGGCRHGRPGGDPGGGPPVPPPSTMSACRRGASTWPRRLCTWPPRRRATARSVSSTRYARWRRSAKRRFRRRCAMPAATPRGSATALATSIRTHFTDHWVAQQYLPGELQGRGVLPARRHRPRTHHP